ncbi:MAG: hypothetical protein KC618_07880, partial [Candidatus Omnitrophica bacterium]|nr:hypothetical protein [Candidatus Omnitrophota bacterium]
QDKVEHSLIVSNCDIIINANYFEMSEFHKQHDYDITIIGSFRHFTIPYGICHIENGGALTRIQEKPEYDYLVNTGMYFLKKDVLKLIPRDEFYNITDLINHVQTQGGRVGVFPIDSKSWIDIGQWDEYHKSIKALEVKHG